MEPEALQLEGQQQQLHEAQQAQQQQQQQLEAHNVQAAMQHHIEQQAAQLIAQGVQVEQANVNANQWQAAAAHAQQAAAAHGPPPLAPLGADAMPRGYRPERLPSYSGATGEDVEAWLFQLEESNRLFPIEGEQHRIRYVALALRDTAARWYAAMQMSEPPQITDWDSFKEKLRKQFAHLDKKFVARNELHVLRQSPGSVREYSVRFKNLQILIPDMSAADALDKYIRGLKDFAWKVWRKKFLTLDEAMLYAEELDLEVHQKEVLARGSNNSLRSSVNDQAARDKPRPSHPLGRDFRPIPWQSRQEPRNFHRGGPTPMELGVLRMKETERIRHMQEDLCFNCHKPGHRANQCPVVLGGSGNGDRRR